uniref:Transmembrane emp24 domain-containing protein p24beta3 isoform X2 n=1 Tax=Elaeis guineensis var. tenera TaxID=51953 RepID=A0A6J0PIZ1_ELAGV|nr:transmembrane emp24 domain-containing protein p24beta3 isoform X2 [Elaeis guineensis]
MERRERSIQFAEVLLILGLLLSCPQRLSALSITVNDVECVYDYVLYEGDTVSGNFVVVDHDLFWSSDHPGIDLVVTSPGGNTVHSMKGTSGDKFEFKAPQAGMYKFCFHNPDRTPETVSFYVHVGHIPNEHDLAKDANESTRRRLIFYTIMEYLVLACASGLQVVYIHRLFNKSVAYNRV